MILLLSVLGGVCFWVLCVGLVIGEGWLRVGGLAGVVLSLAAAFLVDWIQRRSDPQVEVDRHPFDELLYLDWDVPLQGVWLTTPRAKDERRAA